MAVHVGVHELQNFLLPLGQIHRRPPGVERVFGWKCARAVGRSQGDAGRVDREGETPHPELAPYPSPPSEPMVFDSNPRLGCVRFAHSAAEARSVG